MSVGWRIRRRRRRWFIWVGPWRVPVPFLVFGYLVHRHTRETT